METKDDDGMSDQLQDKLDKILDTNFGAKGTSWHDEAIAQIEAAYKDAGWIDGIDYAKFILERNPQSETLQEYLNLVRESRGYPRKPISLTGQEFYDRFKAELDKGLITPGVSYLDNPGYLSTEAVKEAAKRAAGVSDD